MTTTIARSSLKPLVPAMLLASAVAAGCGQPVDTSPAVTITVPSAGQVLTAGQRIDVRFTVSGIDASGTTMAPFQIVGGADMKVPGQGQVRAFLSSSNFIARTVSIPNDANPFFVPDPQYGSAAQLVTPGAKTLKLFLYYNDGSVVDPQREGTVNITIQ